MIRKYLMIGASCFLLGAGTTAYVGSTARAASGGESAYAMLQLFGDVFEMAKRGYVTPVDDKAMIEAALDGMLSSLDPHSGYLNAEDYKDLRDQSRGEYAGLGMELTAEDGVPKVIAPMDGTPAAKAGIQAGDYITAVNGQTVLGQRLDEVVKQLRGEEGTAVTITISRDKKDPFEVKLVRAPIEVKSVRYRMEGDYGYIRIASEGEKTGRETLEAARALAKTPGIKGVVLDLRNNPGGLVDQAVEAADVFLDGGEVVTERERDPKNIERFNAKRGDELHGLPMVVLINSGTASAAEIIAGALQDHKRAEIVGVTSFGKGSVQSVMPLRGGLDGALKLTTGRYYTPSGRSIQKTGIEPEMEVARSAEEAKRIADNASQFSEASYKNALNASEGKVRREAHVVAEAPPKDFDAKGDYQLKRAIDVLRAGSVRSLLAKEKSTRIAETPVKPVAAIPAKPGGR
ncbi:MAG: S41 family peptidase [Caulobacteraceae bacterium]